MDVFFIGAGRQPNIKVNTFAALTVSWLGSVQKLSFKISTWINWISTLFRFAHNWHGSDRTGHWRERGGRWTMIWGWQPTIQPDRNHCGSSPAPNGIHLNFRMCDLAALIRGPSDRPRRHSVQFGMAGRSHFMNYRASDSRHDGRKNRAIRDRK